jgi:hypothetical protein
MACSFVLLGILVYLQIFDDERIKGVLTGVMTTLFIVSFTELVPELAHWVGRFSRMEKFRKLFGAYAFKNNTTLIFPCRYLADAGNAKDPFKTYYDPPGVHVQGGEADQFRPSPEGVFNWLAYQDIRAAVYVSNTIGEITGRKAIAFLDREKTSSSQLQGQCIVSFGLGFTAFTHEVIGLFDPPLFELSWESMSGSTNDNRKTDVFIIPGLGDIKPSSERYDLALVARIVPPRDPRGELPGVWFVCAGKTASGTAAAGYFLATHWDRILDLYQDEGRDLATDSVVIVLEHLKPTPIQADANIFNEYDNTVRALLKDKKEDKKVVHEFRVAASESSSRSEQISGQQAQKRQAETQSPSPGFQPEAPERQPPL